MFSKEVWDDLSREHKTTSYVGFERMSGFHSGHDPSSKGGQKKREKKKNMSKEKIEATYTVLVLCVSAQEVMGCCFSGTGLGGCT